ncbi:hypothetical protein FRB93_007399 [Tulasnella sp. JGI-2019a]|nr:hypothetical protein FRB93_007399 [Tulasnella sp. JGI-2019a]
MARRYAPAAVLLKLPNEILQQIAEQLSLSGQRSIATSCRDLRQVFLPVLFKHVSVQSKASLNALSEIIPSFISYIQCLNISLTDDFFNAWVHDPNSPLTTILTQTPLLQSLILEVSGSGASQDLPWHRLALRTQRFGTGLNEPRQAPQLPIFDRLTHLEFRTGTINALEILLRHAPNLTSLVLSILDGLYDDEIIHLLEVLRYVPALKALSMSVADWETQKPQRGIAHVCDVLRDVAESLPRLEMLDLRTRSFDVIDHTLAFASVGVKYVNIEALCSVMPFFSHLRVLRLPLLINHEAEFSLSRAIASAAPTLEMVSWMYEVHLKAETDEYNVKPSAPR